MRRRKILIGLGYGAFALVALLFSLYLSFPAEAVGQRVVQELSRVSDGALTVSFDGVSPYRLSGIAAEGVRVRVAKQGEQPREFRVKAVRARLNLLPLLWLSTSVSAVIETGSGSLEARLTPRGDKGFFAQLSLEKIALSDPPILAALTGLSPAGIVDGELTADWSPDVRKSTGKATLKLSGAAIEGAIEGVTVPRIAVGNVALELMLDGGRLRVASFSQQGGDLEARLSGSSMLRPQVETSSLDACIEVRPDAKFLERDPKMRAAAQLAEVRLRKSPEGFLSVPLSGTLGSPRLRYGLCRAGQ